MRPRHYRYLLAVIVLVVFARACSSDFVGWDDNHTIYMNEAFNPPTFSGVMSFWSPKNEQAGLWVPVTYMVWGALALIAHLDAPDASGSHLNPWIYHSANVVLHLMTTLVVFELLRRIIRKDRAAFIGAVLFAVHPVQVEAVAWASGLKDVLCGLLTISAAWQYLVFVETRKSRHYIVGLVLFVIGMLSKPTAMITPAIAMMLDVFVVRRPWRQVARDIWPWFALALPCLVWTKYFQPALGIPTAPMWARPLLAANNLAFYLYKLVWPATLAIDYGRRPLVLLDSGQLYWTWPIPLIVAAMLWRVRKTAPLIVLAAILFVIGVLPVIGFTRFLFQFFSAAADHYLYIAMLGPALALAWCVRELRANRPGLVMGAVVVVLTAFGVRSIVQEGTWSDDLTLFNHTIAVNPDSFMAYHNRAATFDRMAVQGTREQLPILKQRAMDDLQRAVAINPMYSKGHDNLATLYIERGEIEKGIEHIKLMLASGHHLPPELRGNVYMSDLVLGRVLIKRGDLAGAEECFADALGDRPGDAMAQQELDRVRRLLATRPAGTSRP